MEYSKHISKFLILKCSVLCFIRWSCELQRFLANAASYVVSGCGTEGICSAGVSWAACHDKTIFWVISHRPTGWPLSDLRMFITGHRRNPINACGLSSLKSSRFHELDKAIICYFCLTAASSRGRAKEKERPLRNADNFARLIDGNSLLTDTWSVNILSARRLQQLSEHSPPPTTLHCLLPSRPSHSKLHWDI